MHGAPDVLRTLAERFDATAFDAPRGSARLRLRVVGERDWDATVEHGLMRLAPADASALFYALLLKDLGCSSNAAKIAYLFGADDQLVKRSARMIDWTKPGQALSHCWQHCSPGGSMLEKLLKIAAIARLGKKGGQQIAEIRCQRGADIARMLRLPGRNPHVHPRVLH